MTSPQWVEYTVRRRTVYTMAVSLSEPEESEDVSFTDDALSPTTRNSPEI